MPNIREFDAPPNLSLQPSDTGVSATAAAARRIGTFYNQAAGAQESVGAEAGSAIRAAGDVAVKYAEHDEISKGAANFAQLQANLTNRWNQTAKTADPNDPTVAAKFQQDVLAPALEQFSDSFNTEGGQRFAEQHVDALREHMFNKTTADMSTMAGIAVQTNMLKTVNTLSSTVRNDPSSLDFALNTVDSSIDGVASSSPNLTGTQAAQVKSELMQRAKGEIVKSYLMGVAEKNPDEANRIIESGKYGEYISGSEAKTLIGYARTNQRLGQAEDRNARVMNDYQAKMDFHKAANDLELSTIPAAPTDRPTLPQDYWQKVRQIGQMPGAALEPSRLKSMVENGERITERLSKPEPIGPISHNTTIQLLNRIRATDASRLESNDPIYQAYGEGKLNTTDFNFLQKEYADIRTPEGQALNRDRSLFFKNFAGTIDPQYDPVKGSVKVYNAEMDARRQEGELRRKGLDPHLTYDPRSEYFIGKPANLQKWQQSIQVDLEDKAQAKSINLTADGSVVTGIERIDLPPADPPQRTVGHLYDTPKGKLRWTGTGWVKP